MSESVPRGNLPAEELRAQYLVHHGEDGGKLLDAALRAERLAGRQEAVRPEVVRAALVAADQKWDWGRDGHAAARARIDDFAADIAAALLDEVGVAGLTEERTDG